ncbi:MAG: 5-formyltetrahydrofolate cyclo-ligase [Metallibacterium scheffleri]
MPSIPTENPDARQALRNLMRARRAALPARQRLDAGNALAQQLALLPILESTQTLAGYFACSGELPLHEVPGLCRARGIDYLLPVLGRGRSLRFARWQTGASLLGNRYGIPEPDVAESELLSPAHLDLVLVPLLAFARSGMRLGSGGGFYDASFAMLQRVRRPARPWLCGVAYAFQEVDHAHPALQAQPWDVRLDAVLTDRETILCAQDPACTTG